MSDQHEPEEHGEQPDRHEQPDRDERDPAEQPDEEGSPHTARPDRATGDAGSAPAAQPRASGRDTSA